MLTSLTMETTIGNGVHSVGRNSRTVRPNARKLGQKNDTNLTTVMTFAEYLSPNQSLVIEEHIESYELSE